MLKLNNTVKEVKMVNKSTLFQDMEGLTEGTESALFYDDTDEAEEIIGSLVLVGSPSEVKQKLFLQEKELAAEEAISFLCGTCTKCSDGFEQEACEACLKSAGCDIEPLALIRYHEKGLEKAYAILDAFINLSIERNIALVYPVEIPRTWKTVSKEEKEEKIRRIYAKKIPEAEHIIVAW